MAKIETTYQKNKRLLIEMERKLALVCTEPDSTEAQSIIFQYKMMKGMANAVMFGDSFQDKISELGLGLASQITGAPHHYEPENKRFPTIGSY